MYTGDKKMCLETFENYNSQRKSGDLMAKNIWGIKVINAVQPGELNQFLNI